MAKAANAALLVLMAATAATVIKRAIPAERTQPLASELDLIGRGLSSLAVVPLGDSVVRPLPVRDGRIHVVYLFLEECGACDLQKPVWNSLAARLPPTVQVDAVALARPSTSTRYMEQQRISEWTITSPSQVRQLIPLAGAPITLVLGRDGAIRFARMGTFESTEVAVLEDMIGTELAR